MLMDKSNYNEALLISNLSNIESDIITSILNAYEIPYIKKSKGPGDIMEIYFGATSFGIDIYVPTDMLQFAKELINPKNIEES
jgi:hypothetical protein